MYTYEIVNENELYIYKEGQEIAFMYQPHWPDGSDWTAEEAENWAVAKINEMQDPDSEYVAGYNSDNPIIERPPLPPTLESLSNILDQLIIESLEP